MVKIDLRNGKCSIAEAVQLVSRTEYVWSDKINWGTILHVSQLLLKP